MNPVRFSGISTAILKDTTHRADAETEFNRKIDIHLNQLTQAHPGEPDYYAAAIKHPRRVGVSLILDGDDYRNFAFDIQLEKQKWEHTLEQLAQQGFNTSGEFKTPGPQDLTQAPIPPSYNFGNLKTSLDYLSPRDYRDLMAEIPNMVLDRYLNRGTQTLDITV